jgi:hypothetical protein
LSLLLLFNQAGVIAVGTALHLARARSRVELPGFMVMQRGALNRTFERGVPVDAHRVTDGGPARGRGLKLKGRC